MEGIQLFDELKTLGYGNEFVNGSRMRKSRAPRVAPEAHLRCDVVEQRDLEFRDGVRQLQTAA
jgi:hypothetical protein